MPDPADHPLVYLDTPDAAAAFLDEIADARELAVDTEGASFHRFVDRIYLLQLSTRGRSAILDPLPIGAPDGLRRLVESPDVEKVFHDADYDLRLLHQDYGWSVRRVFDTRVAAGFVASSGAGGAKLFRRDFGELLENLSARGEYHWMAGNFLKYGAEEAAFGKKTVADLPVDQHQLIALCAPRLCFISYGIKPGDPNWVDAHGSFMAGVLAGPAYRLLGKQDLGTPGDYLTDPMPPVNTLIGGELAWRQHSGGHTNGPNFPTFFEWAGRYISTPGLRKKE